MEGESATLIQWFITWALNDAIEKGKQAKEFFIISYIWNTLSGKKPGLRIDWKNY